MNVADFLREHHTSFHRLPHRPTYTATDLGQTLHRPGWEIAKPVLLRLGEMALVVLVPATRQVDLHAVEKALDMKGVRLATEAEAAAQFPDMAEGVIPPFGAPYGLKTVMDAHFTEVEVMVFESNSHLEAIEITVADFLVLVEPLVATVARVPKYYHRYSKDSAQGY